MKAQIAKALNISESAIIEVQEWARVLWVKFASGCRFVSKKLIKKPLSLKEAAQVITEKFQFSNSACKAVVWENYGKQRIYLKAIDWSRHLQDAGYIALVNGQWDFSEVRGFGSYRTELAALIA